MKLDYQYLILEHFEAYWKNCQCRFLLLAAYRRRTMPQNGTAANKKTSQASGATEWYRSK